MKTLDMIGIEEILYNGSKEEIENIIKEYKISYSYNEKNKSFEFDSMKLLEKSRGYGNNDIPKCVEYFGATYKN